MGVSKQEFKEKLSKKRGTYTSLLVNTLWEDLEGFGWVLFNESMLKQKLDDLETNIRNDITSAPTEWVRRFRKEILERKI